MSDPFRLAIDTIPGMVWSSLPDGHIDFLNQRWLEYTGLPLERATGWGWHAAVFTDDLPGLLQIWKKVLASEAPGETEARLRRHDGVYRWFLFRAMPLHDSGGTLVKWYGQTTDIEDRKWAEAMLSGEKRLLEMIAKGNSLAVILDALCRLVEELWCNVLVSILLLDAQGRHLRHGAAPSLAESYVLRVDGSPVDPTVGPCGAAAQRNEQVIASDLAADARWPEFRSLALAHGLRACWSTPIPAADGSVLGTFATYFREPGSPTPEQQSQIEQFRHLASIAIERMRDLDALRRSEQRYALAVDAAGDGHIDWIVATDEFYASPRLLEMCGLPPTTTFSSRADFLNRFPFHPGDRERVIAAINAHFSARTARLETQMRILRRGEIRWHHLTGLCSRDSSGVLVRWSAAITDVTERKRAEEALSLSEARYARAMEAAAEGHWEWNTAGDEVFLSARTKELLGFAPDAQFASRADFFARQPIHPDDRQEVDDAHEATVSGTMPRYEIDYRVVPRLGEVRWIRSRGKVFRDERGRPLCISGSMTDITERKLANEAVRRSEERFALAVAGSTDGIWDWDLLTGDMFFSEQAQVLHGISPGPKIRKREQWRALWKLHPDDAAACTKAVDDYLAGRTASYDGEWRAQRPDGSYRWIRTRGICVRDQTGRATRIAGSVSDIDAQKCAEAALRFSEQRYARAMQASGEGHWDWNIETDEYYASPRLLELYGFSPGTTFKGRSDFLARFPIHPDDRQKWEEAVAARFAGKPAQGGLELRIVLHGETRWIHLTALLSRDPAGKPLRWTGSVSDITTRKHAEEALRLSEHRYALAMEATGDGHWDWNIPADKVYVSPLLLDMCGLPADTIFANRAEWVDRFPFFPGERPKYEQAVAEHFAGRTARFDMELRVLPRGETRWIHLTGRCSRDASGTPIRWAGSVTDVTDRHLAEDELQRMERQLRQSQRLEAMGTLAGGIAHDFNNLLGAILGYGEMALRDAPAGSRLRRDLDSIMIAGERGRALVDRILAFSRSGMGERVAVQVEDVVRETIGLFASKLPEGIGFETELRTGRATVMGDATQIHQVLMNLVTNAAQAMLSGGTLRVSLDFARVDVPRVVATGSLAARDYVVLKVADTGSGVPPEILERIFDPFFTTKDVGVGTGLGLSLVHGIVMGLGGAIDVATTVGRGSVFTVYLPLAGDISGMGKAKSPAQPESRRGARERVLVVDDEEALVRLATETLTELGYEPTGFTASTTALDAFLADPEQFDAVVTDESMPGMSGSELIRRVRQIRPTVPILLVSGYLGTAVVRRAQEAGADEVLKKPMSARELANSLDRMLHTVPRRTPRIPDVAPLPHSLAGGRRRKTASASRAGPGRPR